MDAFLKSKRFDRHNNSPDDKHSATKKIKNKINKSEALTSETDKYEIENIWIYWHFSVNIYFSVVDGFEKHLPNRRPSYELMLF